jgi:hypothetical protein
MLLEELRRMVQSERRADEFLSAADVRGNGALPFAGNPRRWKDCVTSILKVPEAISDKQQATGFSVTFSHTSFAIWQTPHSPIRC